MSAITPGWREATGQRPTPTTEGNRVGRSIVSRAFSALSQAFIPRNDWLGPQQPIAPQAPDNVAGRALDYTPGYNIQIMPRAEAEFSFEQIRSLAKYDLIAGLVTRRQDQLAILDWDIKPKDETGLDKSGLGQASESDPRIKKIKDFFSRPCPEYSWDQWMRVVIDEMLVTDAANAYIRRTRGGDVYAFEPIDGATIAPKIGYDGRPPIPPIPAYQQVLHGIPSADFTTDEMIYQIANPKSYKIYGTSPVEMIALTINTMVRRGVSQLNYFTDGTIPDGFLSGPEGWSQSQLESLQAWFDSVLAGDLAKRRQLQVVPHNSKFQEWRSAPLKDDFDEWLARVACFMFAYPPTAFIRTNNRATAEEVRETSTDEGREPVKRWMKGFVDRLIYQGWGIRDLEFIWVDKRATDVVKQAQSDASDVNTGIKSRAEVRASRGLSPIDGADVLTVTTGQGIFPVAHVEALSESTLLTTPVNAGNLTESSSTQVGRATSTAGAGARAVPVKTRSKTSGKDVKTSPSVSGQGKVTKFQHYSDDDLWEMLNSPKGRRAMMMPYRLVRTKDIPYLAGSSINGRTIYGDRRLPKEIEVSGKTIDPLGDFIAPFHERPEWVLVQVFGVPYPRAHPFVTDNLEKPAVEDAGVDWSEYEHELDGYIDETEHEDAKDPPKDLDLKPYPNARAKEMRHRAALEKIMQARPKTLYVSRRLKNADELAKWAKSVGFETVVDDPHVTVAFSKRPIDWESIGETHEEVVVKGGARSIEKFAEGACVLRFESQALEERWAQICSKGASWDWPEYKPHVTITYKSPDGLDISKIDPFDGDLVFSFERMKEVDLNWKDRVKEGP